MDKFLNEFEKKTIISKLKDFNVVNILLNYKGKNKIIYYDVFFIYEGILFAKNIEYSPSIRHSKLSNEFFLRQIMSELDDELCSIDRILFNRDPIDFCNLFNASKEVSMRINYLFSILKSHNIYDSFFKEFNESSQNMCVKYLSNNFSRLNTYNIVVSEYMDRSEEALIKYIKYAKDVF